MFVLTDNLLAMLLKMFYKSNMDSSKASLLLAERLGAALRAKRGEQRRSQGDIAHALGIRRQTVADLENGKNVGLHVALAAVAELGLQNAVGGLLSGGAQRPTPEPWPSNWSVVDRWEQFETALRDGLEAKMRAAPSPADNRREAFIFAPMNVRDAKVVQYPDLGDPHDF